MLTKINESLDQMDSLLSISEARANLKDAGDVEAYLKSQSEVKGVKKVIEVTKDFDNRWLVNEKFILALTGVGLFLFHCSSLNNPTESYEMSYFLQGVTSVDQSKLDIDGMYGKREYDGKKMMEIRVYVSNQGLVQWNMILDTDEEVELKEKFVKNVSSPSSLYIRMPTAGYEMIIQLFRDGKMEYEDRRGNMKKALDFATSGTFKELKFN